MMPYSTGSRYRGHASDRSGLRHRFPRGAGRAAGAQAHGVDVSDEMLGFARARAERYGVRTHWHRAGFLDYAHPGESVEVVTTKSALHQLPDF